MVQEMTNPATHQQRRRRWYWLLAFLLTVVATVVVITPVALIMPFKAQTPGRLELAYLLRRVSPIGVPLLGFAVGALSAGLWRGARWGSRSVLVGLCSLALLFAWFAQQNHFEWMFHPLPRVEFAGAASADFVADTDMVLAVAASGDAAAYPIRQVAYHHVVQDTVGGVPLVVTY